MPAGKRAKSANYHANFSNLHTIGGFKRPQTEQVKANKREMPNQSIRLWLQRILGHNGKAAHRIDHNDHEKPAQNFGEEP